MIRYVLALLATGLALLLAGEAGAQSVKIVALGTSFTAGKHVSATEAWPAQLERLLRAQGETVQVRNEGVDGDTTRDLLRRADRALPADTQLVLYEYALGNDEEAGIRAHETVENSERLIAGLLARKIEVLLIVRGRNPHGLQEHIDWFRPIIDRYRIAFVGLDQEHEQLIDGRHPTAAEHLRIAGLLAGPVRAAAARTR